MRFLVFRDGKDGQAGGVGCGRERGHSVNVLDAKEKCGSFGAHAAVCFGVRCGDRFHYA